MAYTYWAHEMEIPELGTADSLWRHSDAARTWEYRSLIDSEWHQPRLDGGPSAPVPNQLRQLSEQQARDMSSRAPQELYVYTQRLIGDSARPGAVSRRIPSPESFQDQVFSIEGKGGKWIPTTSIAAFTNTYQDDRPRHVRISHEAARRHVRGKAPGALAEFDRPFRANTAEVQRRAAAAQAGKFQSSLSAVPESGEHRSPSPSPSLATHSKIAAK